MIVWKDCKKEMPRNNRNVVVVKDNSVFIGNCTDERFHYIRGVSDFDHFQKWCYVSELCDNAVNSCPDDEEDLW
jgi:hypothetical protein